MQKAPPTLCRSAPCLAPAQVEGTITALTTLQQKAENLTAASEVLSSNQAGKHCGTRRWAPCLLVWPYDNTICCSPPGTACWLHISLFGCVLLSSWLPIGLRLGRAARQVALEHARNSAPALLAAAALNPASALPVVPRLGGLRGPKPASAGLRRARSAKPLSLPRCPLLPAAVADALQQVPGVTAEQAAGVAAQLTEVPALLGQAPAGLQSAVDFLSTTINGVRGALWGRLGCCPASECALGRRPHARHRRRDQSSQQRGSCTVHIGGVGRLFGRLVALGAPWPPSPGLRGASCVGCSSGAASEHSPAGMPVSQHPARSVPPSADHYRYRERLQAAHHGAAGDVALHPNCGCAGVGSPPAVCWAPCLRLQLLTCRRCRAGPWPLPLARAHPGRWAAGALLGIQLSSQHVLGGCPIPPRSCVWRHDSGSAGELGRARRWQPVPRPCRPCQTRKHACCHACCWQRLRTPAVHAPVLQTK